MVTSTEQATAKRTRRAGAFRLYVLAGAALLAAACGRSSPSAPHPGESVMTSFGEVSVTFVRVNGDSRCSIDAVCVWSGNARVVVTIRVGTQVSDERTLNTHLEPHSTDFARYRVRLDSLLPYPVSTRTIEPDEYQAYFTVSRRDGGGSP
jgi:hypothetical protein